MDAPKITSRLWTLVTGRMMILSTVVEQECRGGLRSSGLERREKLEK